MDFYLTAHGHLSTEKDNGDYIPWSAMDRYARRYGMDEEFFEHFVSAMIKIDQRIAEGRKAEQEKKEKASAKQAAGKGAVGSGKKT